MNRIEKLREQMMKLNKTGFFSIFISNVFSKVIALLGGIILVRILSKEDYGIYGYVINAMTMLYLLNDFGASNATLQHLTEERENKEKQKSIVKYSLKISIISSVFSGVLILLSPLFYPFKIEEARDLTPILFIVPMITNINNFIAVILRSNLENRKYAILELSKTILNYIFLLLLSFLLGMKGAIVSQYFYLIGALIIGIFLSHKTIGNFSKSEELKKEEKKQFLKYSLTTQINSTLSALLLNIDLFIIGICIGSSEAVALYKVASTIPMALSFLPTCVIIYVLPYFVKHNNDSKWLKENHSKMIKLGFMGYGIMTLILILGAKLIFNLFYTHEYDEAINTFRILMIGFFFSATIKIPTANILYAMRKLKYNLIVTIISVLFNFIFNILFIHLFGINGAAITTTAINIFTSILLLFYMKKTMKEGEQKNEENVY